MARIGSCSLLRVSRGGANCNQDRGCRWHGRQLPFEAKHRASKHITLLCAIDTESCGVSVVLRRVSDAGIFHLVRCMNGRVNVASVAFAMQPAWIVEVANEVNKATIGYAGSPHPALFR